MTKPKVTSMPGNSTYADLNVYRDTDDPTVFYHGTKGGKGPTRNRWVVIREGTNGEAGPFPTLGAAWAWMHRGNGSGAPVARLLPETVPIPTPGPKAVDDLPLLQFKCPHCGHPLVGLVAAE